MISRNLFAAALLPALLGVLLSGCQFKTTADGAPTGMGPQPGATPGAAA